MPELWSKWLLWKHIGFPWTPKTITRPQLELYLAFVTEENRRSPENAQEEAKKQSDENFNSMLKEAQEKGTKTQTKTNEVLKKLVEKLKAQKEKIDAKKASN